MSAFSALLDQFKQTTQKAATLSPDGFLSAETATSTSILSEFSAKVVTTRHERTNNNSNRYSEKPHQHYYFPSTPVRTIYIACPAFVETGGPEALHQLCHMINNGKYPVNNNSGQDCIAGFKNPTQSTNLNDMYHDHDDGHDTKQQQREKISADATDDCGKTEFDKMIDCDVGPTVNACMLYLREKTSGDGILFLEHIPSSRARPSKYDRYLAPPALQLPGCSASIDTTQVEYSSDLVIWPECWTQFIDTFQPDDSKELDIEGGIHDENMNCRQNYNSYGGKMKKYQTAIWWLSVNNNHGKFTNEQFVIRQDVLHLVQSAYAREYVLSMLLQQRDMKRGDGGESNSHRNNDYDYCRNLLSLTEYIPNARPLPVNISKSTIRDLDIVYNPAKGMHYTDELIRRMCGEGVGGGRKRARGGNREHGERDDSTKGRGRSIQFTPIGKGVGGRVRMTGEEVGSLLRRSKVYIDFGPHPGMDRLPREAALAGCVVITNCEGAANFHEDVPLPLEFKFRSFDVDKICTMLRDCCNDYPSYFEKMKPYREWILGQEKQMTVCVDRLVQTISTHRGDHADG